MINKSLLKATSDPEATYSGDWRDLRDALERTVHNFSSLQEEDRRELWNFSAKLLENYGPLYVKCSSDKCGKVIRVRAEAYRCADCRAFYCENHIKPHFKGLC